MDENSKYMETFFYDYKAQASSAQALLSDRPVQTGNHA